MKSLTERARSYTRIKNLIQLFELVFIPGILFIILYFGINELIKITVLKIVHTPYLAFLFYLIFLGLLLYITNLPIKFFTTYVLEHRFGLSNQTLYSWIKKEAKALLVVFIIGSAFAGLVYFFIRNSGLYWWLLTALLWVVLSVFLGKFAPVLILPLFYKVWPVKETELNVRLLNLAKKSGADVNGVFEIDSSKETKKANAALMGIGKTRRIILCDTLLKNFLVNEIEIVLAHELGHHRKFHIRKLLILSSLVIFIELYLTNLTFLKTHNYFKVGGLEDLTSIPLLLLVVILLGVLIRPVINVYSRSLERSADRFALKLTGDPNAFINTMKKLAEQNLSDISPNRFVEIMLYDHPPISKRIALAEEYK